MGIYPFEDYQNHSPYIHTPNDIIGTSVTSFEMSQQFCQMNIGCLAEIATVIGDAPVVECNPVTNFYVGEPVAKDLSEVYLEWQRPEEGSTGELQHFDVYRDNAMIATVEIDPDPTYHYIYTDTITVGASAEYFVTAVYSDGCEAQSETLVGYGVTGLEETNRVEAQVYPNPVEGQLTVKAEGLLHVAVYNSIGQQVVTVEAYENQCTIDMSNYPAGLYSLQMVSSKGINSKNVIVK